MALPGSKKIRLNFFSTGQNEPSYSMSFQSNRKSKDVNYGQ